MDSLMELNILVYLHTISKDFIFYTQSYEYSDNLNLEFMYE